MSRSYKDGDVPLWNPYSFAGTPFVAANANNALYPPRVALSLTPLSPSRVHDVFVASHMLLAGLAMYLLLAYFRTSFLGALLGAVAWMASSFVLAWLALEHFTVVAALFPVAVLLADATVRRRSWPAALALGPVLALLFLGGNVLFVELCFVTVGTYMAALDVARRIRVRLAQPAQRSRAGSPAISHGLSCRGRCCFGLSSIALLPTLELGAIDRPIAALVLGAAGVGPSLEANSSDSSYHRTPATTSTSPTCTTRTTLRSSPDLRWGSRDRRSLGAQARCMARACARRDHAARGARDTGTRHPLPAAPRLRQLQAARASSLPRRVRGCNVWPRSGSTSISDWIKRVLGGRRGARAAALVGVFAVVITIGTMRLYSSDLMHDQALAAEQTFPETPLVARLRQSESVRFIGVGAGLAGIDRARVSPPERLGLREPPSRSHSGFLAGDCGTARSTAE